MNYALLVGINTYQTPGNDLRGCVHDVANMRVLLADHGFSVLHVRSLINEQATKKRILDSLTQMVGNMKEGDHGVFHFSGHGSQTIDTNNDEGDSLDEILCPYDFDWSGTYITDDGLREILSNLHSGATIDVVFDACHSGTGLRDVGIMPKCIPYPGPWPILVGENSYKVRGLLSDHDLPNVALWAGCRDDQTSSDAFIDGVYQGAMTWAFMEAMESHNFMSYPDALSRARVIERVTSDLAYEDYDQEPQLECCDEMAKRRIFT